MQFINILSKKKPEFKIEKMHGKKRTKINKLKDPN